MFPKKNIKYQNTKMINVVKRRFRCSVGAGRMRLVTRYIKLNDPHFTPSCGYNSYNDKEIPVAFER